MYVCFDLSKCKFILNVQLHNVQNYTTHTFSIPPECNQWNIYKYLKTCDNKVNSGLLDTKLFINCRQLSKEPNSNIWTRNKNHLTGPTNIQNPERNNFFCIKSGIFRAPTYLSGDVDSLVDTFGLVMLLKKGGQPTASTINSLAVKRLDLFFNGTTKFRTSLP